MKKFKEFLKIEVAMKFKHLKTILLLFSIFIIILGTDSIVLAKDYKSIKVGFTFGVILPYNSFPKAGSNFGTGGSFGAIFEKGSILLNIVQSTNKLTDVIYVKDGSRAIYTVVDLTFKYYFPEIVFLKPSLFIGPFWIDIISKNSMDVNGYLVGDVFYEGYGLQLGAGVNYDLSSKFSLYADIVYRNHKFTKYWLFEEEKEIAEELSGEGLNFYLGFNYNLWLRR